MKEWIFWIDLAARLGAGLLLVVLPKPLISLLGLPKVPETFWPRMTGILLLAIACGTAIEVRFPGKGGPSLGGLVALNLAAAFALATALVVGQLDIPRRGRLLVWLAALCSAILGLVQLAWV